MTTDFLQPLIWNYLDRTSQVVDVWRAFSDTLLSEFILLCSERAYWIKVPPGTKKGFAISTRQYSKVALPDAALPANRIYSALTWMTGEYSAACSDGKKARVLLPGCGCFVLHSVGSRISKASLVTRWSANTPVKGVGFYIFLTFDTWLGELQYGTQAKNKNITFIVSHSKHFVGI